MPNDGKTVTVDRLLRRSTLQDHITIDELPMPEGSQKVELIKLRNSFTEFATEEESDVANPTSTLVVGSPRVGLEDDMMLRESCACARGGAHRLARA